MSLKDFHLVFIVCSVILSAGFGVWGLNQFQQSGVTSYLMTAAGSFLAAVGLAVYAVFFLRKLTGVN
jgi:hypothetical protein